MAQQPTRPMDPAIALALAPFSPPDSEARRIATDLRIQQLRDSGELRARQIHRLHLQELNEGAHE